MPFLAPAVPFLIKAAPFIATTIGSALGKGGKQGGQANTGTSRTTQDINETVSQTELPEIAAFRNTLFPAFGQALQDAQAPLFSENAQAAFLGRINDLSGKAIDTISSNLARRGALNSGAAGSAFTDVELSRNRDITDFLTQLPILERETRFNQTLPLLNAGMAFAGRGPLQTTSSRTGGTTTESSGNVDIGGSSILRALAGEGSSLLNLILSGVLQGGNNTGQNIALGNIPGVNAPPVINPANPTIDPIMASIIFGDGNVPLPLGS